MNIFNIHNPLRRKKQPPTLHRKVSWWEKHGNDAKIITFCLALTAVFGLMVYCAGQMCIWYNGVIA